MAETKNGLSAEFISHPGETLFELLEQYGISQKELSIKTQTSEKHINEIIKGKKDISVAFAKKLENVFKPNASFWINRQSIYAEKIENLRIIENISKEEKEILNQFPISELVSYGYLKEERNDVEQVLALRKFSGTSNLLNTLDILDYMLPNLSFKTDKTKSKYNPYKMYAWLRMCQIETEYIYNPNVYSSNLLRDRLLDIKRLSMLSDFNQANKRIQEILYSCGINYKIVHNFKGLKNQGFIKPINDNVSLCVTIKWHKEDVFWFALFHEFGHLLHKRNSRMNIDVIEDNDEDEANNFARDFLIKPDTYKVLISDEISRNSIIKCASDNEICPAIVVGRLINDGYLKPNMFHDLIRSLNWAD